MKNILIVDDQPHIIRVIRLSLERNGYHVDTAVNGKQALEMLDATVYDVMITDLEMPQMNGQDLCEAMHARLPGAAPYTLVVTAKANPALKKWAQDIPDTQYIEKPISLRQLNTLLEAYFSSTTVQRQA